MNPANLTAAERDTKLMLEALEFYRTRTCRTEEERAECARLIERLSAPVAEPTPRFNSWWNSYRSGAITADQFKEAVQGMERELETCRENYGKLYDAHEIIVARLGQAENTIRYAQPPQAPEPVNAQIEGMTDTMVSLLDQLNTERTTNADLLAALKRAWADKNWMLNNGQLLSADTFGYMDEAIARAESALAAQKGGK